MPRTARHRHARPQIGPPFFHNPRKPIPYALVELRVELDGETIWMPAEAVSYPTPDGRIYVRTWPGRSWSAVWVGLDRIREAPG